MKCTCKNVKSISVDHQSDQKVEVIFSKELSFMVVGLKSNIFYLVKVSLENEVNDD